MTTGISYRTTWVIDTYEDGRLVHSDTVEGNLLLREGLNHLWALAAGDTFATPWNAYNAHIGVGDSDDGVLDSQTGLQAATNKAWSPMDAGYPTYGSNETITFKATFGAALANFDWNEFTVCNANSDAGQNLNRRVSAQGEKELGQVRTVTVSIALS